LGYCQRVGLFACGLGVANLYPLSLALTLAAAAPHGDLANARSQLLGGVFVIAAPDLIGLCGLLLLAGLRTGRGTPGRPDVLLGKEGKEGLSGHSAQGKRGAVCRRAATDPGDRAGGCPRHPCGRPRRIAAPSHTGVTGVTGL
jgi:hypothetical protein